MIYNFDQKMLKKRAHPTGIEHAKQRLRSEHNNHAARRPYYLLEWVHIRFLFAKFPNFGQSVSRNLTASTQILLLFLNLRLKLHVLLNFQVFSLMKHFFPKLDASLVVENRPVVTECPGVVDYSVIDQKFGISVSEYPILHVRVTFLRL